MSAATARQPYRAKGKRGSDVSVFKDPAIVLPQHIEELSDRKLLAFACFLSASGAEVFKSRANRYEVLRFKTGTDVAAIYRDRRGWLKFTGPSGVAWRAFASNSPWRAVPRTEAIGAERENLVAALIGRDGRRCFYCPEIIPTGLETIEHLVPATAGGPNHLSNLFLAHRACNEDAGALSAPEKIRLRERHYGFSAASDRLYGERVALDVIEELAAIADRYPDDERDTRWLSNVALALARRARLARQLYDAARIGEIVDDVIARARAALEFQPPSPTAGQPAVATTPRG